MNGGSFDMRRVMELAREFQERLVRVKEELKRRRVEADSGAGMVRVAANGLGEIIEVKIDPSLSGERDVPMLEDLVRAAVNEAIRRAKEVADEEHRKLTGGIAMPFDISGLGGPAQ